MCQPKFLESEEITEKFSTTEVPVYYMYDEDDDDQEEEYDGYDDTLVIPYINEAVLQLAEDLLKQLNDLIRLLTDMIGWFGKMKDIIRDMALSKVMLKLIENSSQQSICWDIYEDLLKNEDKYEYTINGFVGIVQHELETSKQRMRDIVFELEYGIEESLIDSINLFFNENNEFQYSELFVRVWALNNEFKSNQEVLLARFRDYSKPSYNV